MDRRLSGKKVKVRLTSPDDFRVRVEDVKRHTPEVCPACGGWGTCTNGFDGTPEMCGTCQGTGEVE